MPVMTDVLKATDYDGGNPPTFVPVDIPPAYEEALRLENRAATGQLWYLEEVPTKVGLLPFDDFPDTRKLKRRRKRLPDLFRDYLHRMASEALMEVLSGFETGDLPTRPVGVVNGPDTLPFHMIQVRETKRSIDFERSRFKDYK